MFWLGFLFGDENHKLRELEQRKKDRQAEHDKEILGFMVEELTPQLDFMEKNNLESLTFTLLDPSKFNYNLLSQALSKIGSKIAYTRLEKFEGKFLLTFYKNRPEAISWLYLAMLLRGLLWLVVAAILTYFVYTFVASGFVQLTSEYTSTFLMKVLLNFTMVSFSLVNSNVIAGSIFRQSKIAKEFQHTLRFDKVVEND